MKLEGFTSHLVIARGTIELAVMIGEGCTMKMANVEFMVMDLNSSCNMIPDIPAQCTFSMIASIPYQSIKYHTENGTDTMHNDPKSILQQIVRTTKDKQKLVVTSTDE